jgi:Photosystem I reaction centre subunit XI
VDWPAAVQVVLPVNGDPYIGMLETPVTSAPIVAGYLSNLPAYRTGVSPLLRGVEIGLAHGLLVGDISVTRVQSASCKLFNSATWPACEFVQTRTARTHVGAHGRNCT